MTYLQGLKSIFNLRTLIVVLIFSCIVYYYYSHQDWELEVRISSEKRIDLLTMKDQVECIYGFQDVFPGLTFHRDPIENEDDADLYLQCPPNSAFQFNDISIYSDAELLVKYGILEAGGEEIPDSITFEISVSDGERTDVVMTDSIEPRDKGKIKQFRFINCDLDAFEDSVCTLRFQCKPSSECPPDALICAWGNLKIDSSGNRDLLKRIKFGRETVHFDLTTVLDESAGAQRIEWAKGSGGRSFTAPLPWGIENHFTPFRDADNEARYERTALVFGEAARIDVPMIRIPDEDEVALTFAIGLHELSAAAGGATFTIDAQGKEVFREVVEEGRFFDLWRNRSIDLSAYAGQEVSLSFAVDYPSFTPVEVPVPSQHPMARGEEGCRIRVEQSLAAFGHPKIVGKQRIHRRFASSKKSPNLIVINIDSLPASYLGCYGAPYGLTPTMDRMAEVGILFKDACTCSPQAMPSMATVLTGIHPSVHRVGDGDTSFLNHAFDTLPERAQFNNVTTAAFVAGSGIGEYAGFDRGFETYVHLPGQNARKLNALFNDWLISNGSFRFFAYLHYGDPHAPFSAPAGLKNRYVPSHLRDRVAESKGFDQAEMTEAERTEYLRGRYFGEIEYVDRRIQDVLSLLGDFGLMNKTIIIVTSSFGQAFMEHGVMGHGRDLYNESIRVPLILCGPDNFIGPHRVVEGMVDHSAIASTCGHFLGLDGDAEPPRNSSEHVSPLEARTLEQNSHAWSELFLPIDQNRTTDRHLCAVMDWRYKLISDGVLQELYDTVEDPLERKNLSGTGMAVQDELLKKMDEILMNSRSLIQSR